MMNDGPPTRNNDAMRNLKLSSVDFVRALV